MPRLPVTSLPKLCGPRGSGQGLVEFALVLPILLLATLAVVDFGRLLVTYAGVVNGAREATRYGAVPGRNARGDYNYTHCAEMRERARSAVPLMTVRDDQIALGFDHGQFAPPPDIFVYTCEAVDPEQIAQGDRVVARVTAEVPLVTPLLNNLWPSLTVQFTAARTLVKDGFPAGPTTTAYPTRTPMTPSATPSPSRTAACQGPDGAGACTQTAMARTLTATNRPPTATRTPSRTPTAGPSPTPSQTHTRAPTRTRTPTPTATLTPGPTSTRECTRCNQTRTAVAQTATARASMTSTPRP